MKATAGYVIKREIVDSLVEYRPIMHIRDRHKYTTTQIIINTECIAVKGGVARVHYSFSERAKGHSLTVICCLFSKYYIDILI